jgi:membrane-bound inhibitor of C-type lysozyme
MLAAMSPPSSGLPRPLSSRQAAIALVAATLVATTGCSSKPSKEEEEAARNTFACQLRGERLVLRFDAGEARLLMPGGERIVLYQLPAASGVRFSNGTLELRGKGTDLQLLNDSGSVPLVDCQPYSLPKAS